MFETESEQNAFLQRYKISQETFLKSHVSWNVLSEIAADYESEERKSELSETVESCVAILEKCPQVHSLKARKKEVDHLIEKIIRKNPDFFEEGHFISVKNYRKLITDLIGVRIVYLFKDDWEDVNDYIQRQFEGKFNEHPFAYFVTPEEKKKYLAKGLDVKERNDYRSVHYVVKYDCACVEIQVRTLAEEVWGEIDHNLRYPYNKSNEVLGKYMTLMSTLTGCVDNMATFISHYLSRFDCQDVPSYTNQVYNSILSELENIQGNEEVVDKIRNMIKRDESFQEFRNTSELIEEIISGRKGNSGDD